MIKIYDNSGKMNANRYTDLTGRGVELFTEPILEAVSVAD